MRANRMYSWTLILILSGVEIVLPGFKSETQCMEAMERFIQTDQELRTGKASLSNRYSGVCQEKALLNATELP